MIPNDDSASGTEDVPSGRAARVSVVVPTYNAQDYVAETLTSVLSQTMGDLEVFAVDDASTDRTREVLTEIARQDDRVTVLVQDHNQGVAAARNRGLACARTRYVAYLDADDQWVADKLERQLEFMGRTGVAACMTSYMTIEQDGTPRNVVHVPDAIGYRGFLKNTITCSSTLLVDTGVINKSLLVMPDLRRGQDAATWLQVMKEGHRFYGLDEPLVLYRKTPGSLSSAKIAAVRRTWHLYREVEHLSYPYSAYCLFWQLFHAVQKRRKGA